MKQQTLISFFSFFIFLAASTVVTAQSNLSNENIFEKGTVTFSTGVGIGNEYSSNYYSAAFGVKSVIEKGIWQAGPGTISLGGEMGGSFSNGGSQGNYKASTIIIAGRSAWHNGWNVKNLDTYAGLSAGLGFNQYRFFKDEYINQSEVIPVFAGFIGASYFITPKFGFNVEIGNDITRIQAGIILKVK